MTVEHHLGYFFFDKELLKRSLTRPSYASEKRHQNQDCDDQGIYQALGRAVMQTVLAELLIRAGTTAGEELTARMAALMQAEKLGAIAKNLELEDHIRLTIDERLNNATADPQVLTETLEALIGGIYFDGGYGSARQAVKQLFRNEFRPPDEE